MIFELNDNNSSLKYFSFYLGFFFFDLNVLDYFFWLNLFLPSQDLIPTSSAFE